MQGGLAIDLRWDSIHKKIKNVVAYWPFAILEVASVTDIMCLNVKCLSVTNMSVTC